MEQGRSMNESRSHIWSEASEQRGKIVRTNPEFVPRQGLSWVRFSSKRQIPPGKAGNLRRKAENSAADSGLDRDGRAPLCFAIPRA
jgi:hypothetical protein